MNRFLWMLGLVAAYLLSGCYIVGSDEQVAVSRFGRWQPELRTSGLHWDGPMPFVQLQRLNLAELRTVSIGTTLGTGTDILPTAAQRPCSLLTGDKNVLQLRVQLQYRIDPAHVADYLFRHAELERRLMIVLESLLVETASQVGVDYLHTLGISALNARLTSTWQQHAETYHLGIVVDRVTLESIDPPAQVLADFQDVANARSEAAQVIQQARTSAEQRLTAARSQAQERIAAAESDRRAMETATLAQAARFTQLQQELRSDVTVSYAQQKSRWEQQLTRELLQTLMAAGVQTWLFDGQQPIQLQIQGRTPERRAPTPVAE